MDPAEIRRMYSLALPLEMHHWKCSKVVALLCRPGLKLFPFLVWVHIKTCLLILIISRKVWGTFSMSNVKYLLSSCFIPHPQAMWMSFIFCLFIDSLEYFFKTFHFQEALKLIRLYFPLHSEYKPGYSIYTAWCK